MAQILGRVGKIEAKTTANGMQVTNISMVTSKKIVKNGEKEEKVTWHNVVFFSKLAEIAEKYVAIGDMLYIQGEMESQKYIKDGQERTKFFIIGNDLRLLPKSKEHKSEPKKELSYEEAFEDSEVPF
jgi:single-strand DNA-binding protein